MKKVILGTTLATSLLLVGGITASAAVNVTNLVDDIPVQLNFAEAATFTFNTEAIVHDGATIAEALLDGVSTVEGTITGITGTLENLTAITQEVTFSVNHDSIIEGITVGFSNEQSNKLSVISVDTKETDPGQLNIIYSINQAFAREFAAKLEEEEQTPIITVTASDTIDSGNGQQL
ncbi:hypothetical protein EQ871_14495 [Enterococcus casseliflavus]|jgi:hypothetical protein|uniref:hypothetical protein n=1 Tax=Enterococcus TaxID=1350 RepID=UPI000FFBC8D1|nr:hypothetical protein [Enterococcus casseliflavus]NKD37754.1 hypothetical protein [Enterococcus casseliflavus]RXA60379.1 hypothetical protein EQ871_14495 [Enterococcus casseliflavus]